VPASLGVQEGAYIAVGAALGLPAEMALAASLILRLRQLVLGVPALLSWQIAETRVVASAAAKTPPSSASNAYLRRWLRPLLRRFAGTRLTPNAITSLRLVTGLGACVACAWGGSEAGFCAAILWILSAVFDRADGEFARLSGKCSACGHDYDYYGDILINSLIFLAMGFHLRSGALGPWAMLLGLFAAAAVAIASVLAEQVDLQSGAKSFPSRGGLDFDDLVFLLAPILWLGPLLPLLAGAALGAPAVSVVLWRRLARRAGNWPPRPGAARSIKTLSRTGPGA
jgi:phosphatidylglycerophosphate synthase